MYIHGQMYQANWNVLDTLYTDFQCYDVAAKESQNSSNIPLISSIYISLALCGLACLHEIINEINVIGHMYFIIVL